MTDKPEWEHGPQTAATHIANALHEAQIAHGMAGLEASEALKKAETWLQVALDHSPAPSGPDPKNDPPPPLEREHAE